MTKFLRVAVALSGGIDSAVAAVILRNKGFNLTGTFIKYYDSNDESAKTMHKDLEHAKWLCNELKIPLKEIDLVNECWRNVYTNIIADYNVGYVPNADTIFNEYITFECYHRHCLDILKVDAVATGHYAQSSFGPFLQKYNAEQLPTLLRSVDSTSDQTYVLSRIGRKALQRTMFPVGVLTKSEVKNIARQHSLDRILQREDSSELCFMNSRHYDSFISRYVLGKHGKCLDVDTGEVVGEHRGIHLWPIGQCYPPNYYVVGNDEKNVIFVTSSKDHPAFYSRSLTLSYCHRIKEESRKRFFRATFQHLNNGTIINGKFADLLDYPEGGYVFLESEKPLHNAVPGQYVVLYDGEECLGSMKIMNTGPSEMFYQEESEANRDKIRKKLLHNSVVNKK